MNTMIESYKAGLFQIKYWLPNIFAGIIVGIVALPLAMAFAIASGTKPEQGIYTAIIAGLIVSTFGGSRYQIAGPTGAFIVILAGITSKYGVDGLQIATLIAGVMLFCFGLARLGNVIKFIPYPVILGFTSGIAIVIWVGQWHYFFGLPAPRESHFHEQLWALIQSLPHLNAHTTLLSIFTLIILLTSNKVFFLKRIPSPLIALMFGIAIQTFYPHRDIQTLGTVFNGIPTGLPAFHWPALSIDRILELIAPAFTIALLGAIESLLSAVVADGMTNSKHHSNRELMGQGIANIVSPLFGGFAATGAIARTATNIRNGGNNPIAGIVHALTLVTVILYLAPYAINIPLATLSAILFVVAWNMSEAKHFIKLIKLAPRADVLILLTTFFITIFVNLVTAVNIGVILAALIFIKNMSKSVEVRPQDSNEIAYELAAHNLDSLPNEILIYLVEGPFFFAAVDVLTRALKDIHLEPKILILRLRWVPFIDATGLQTLADCIQSLQNRGIKVFISGAKTHVEEKLLASGIVEMINKKNIFIDFQHALRTALDEI